jgi:quinol monooxygenase YgiN
LPSNTTAGNERANLQGMSKIAVLAKLVTLPGMRADVIEILSAQVAAVADEAGTEVYALHVDPADEVTVWFYELYVDKAALDFHGTTDAMKALGPKLAGKLGGRPELTLLTPVVAKGL